MTVWESIALHTTRQVPNYKQPEVRLVAVGVQYDVNGSDFDTLTAEQRDVVRPAPTLRDQGTGNPLHQRRRRASSPSR